MTTRRDFVRLALASGLTLPFAAPAFAASAGTFDDGNDAIPEGVGDPERVIIVGAGWAGLTLANALRNAGVDFVLLEARGRIGGRAHTADLGGAPVDLGCSWIHQPIGNPMNTFADMAGVARVSADVELDAAIMRFYDDKLRRELLPEEKLQALGHAFNFAEFESANLDKELGPGKSVADGAIAYFDRNNVQGDARRQATTVIKMLSEFTYGTDWRRLSLHDWAWGNSESTYEGVGEGVFPVGGYRGLYRAMAGSTDVRLHHRVTAVELRKHGVTVRARAGGRRIAVRGSHVVMTVPLGLLKDRVLRFEPGLPPAKRKAIEAAGFGVIEKVALVFEEAFWSDALHTHIVHVAADDGLAFPWFVDLNRISQIPGLIAFNGGPFARSLDTRPRADRVEMALAQLKSVLQRDIPRPVAARATDWGNDPFSHGSYSAMRLGDSAANRDALAQPVAGRILFAGEATNRVRHSTADGALSTGIREAKRLLGKPAVTLSAG